MTRLVVNDILLAVDDEYAFETDYFAPLEDSTAARNREPKK